MPGLAVADGMRSLEAQFRQILSSAERLAERGLLGEAQALLRVALRVRPRCAAAHNTLGTVLFDAGRMAEALLCFRSAALVEPLAAAAWGNAGMVLKTLDRFDEAFAAYDRAVALDPGLHQLRLNRAVALLRAGRMAEGWEDYESRIALSGALGASLQVRLLPTLGADGPDLRGRTVLIEHEEGFGDTLHFARYVPMLAGLGARVVVRLPRELARLLRDVTGVVGVLEGAAEAPPHDYTCPFFSLPRAFATTLETIPASIPYLRAEPELVERWRSRLPWANSSSLRVGLVWAGQARPWLPGFAAVDRRRSAGLGVFAALGSVPAEFVRLQMHGPGDDSGDRAARDFAMHDPMADVRDFSDTAALIAHLDVVVSVDTSVVHLAGGMGKPVLMLDRFDSCWRWLSGRTDSPWYPTLRIFRQSTPGVWDDAIRGVADALAELAAAKFNSGQP